MFLNLTNSAKWARFDAKILRNYTNFIYPCLGRSDAAKACTAIRETISQLQGPVKQGADFWTSVDLGWCVPPISRAPAMPAATSRAEEDAAGGIQSSSLRRRSMELGHRRCRPRTRAMQRLTKPTISSPPPIRGSGTPLTPSPAHLLAATNPWSWSWVAAAAVWRRNPGDASPLQLTGSDG
jgi:hypothetical protein